MEAATAELSDEDLRRVDERIDILESEDERSEDQEQELAALKRTVRKLKRKVRKDEAREALLADELAVVQRLLQEAKVREATHFRSHDNWDEEQQARAQPFAKSTSFWMRSDWTTEEKVKLNAARAAIALGTLGGIWSIGGSILRFAGTIVGYEAAEERLAGDNSTTNALLRDQAGIAIGNEADGLLNTFNVSLGALATGVAGYYYVANEHSKRIDALNEPQAGKDVKDFEKSAAAVKARLESLQSRLAEEKLRLAAAKRKLSGKK